MESFGSDRAAFGRISTSTDGPNELRPYYRPPSISLVDDESKLPPSSSSANFSTIFSDLGYDDYISDSAPSLGDLVSRLRDEAIYSYVSVLLSQPFEVAKVVLQTYDAGKVGGSTLDSADLGNGVTVEDKRVYSEEFVDDTDSDEEFPSYFAPTSPHETPSHRPQRKRPLSRSQSGYISSEQASQQQQIILKRPDSIIEVLGHLWSTERQWGWWKGTNSTFIYGVLFKTIEAWSRGFLTTVLNIPDPVLLRTGLGGNILDSPNPYASVGIVVAAAGIAGFLLGPIDMIRTR
jgi:fusion and transport protein UGO1